jgi:hypothetical protein
MLSSIELSGIWLFAVMGEIRNNAEYKPNYFKGWGEVLS